MVVNLLNPALSKSQASFLYFYDAIDNPLLCLFSYFHQSSFCKRSCRLKRLNLVFETPDSSLHMRKLSSLYIYMEKVLYTRFQFGYTVINNGKLEYRYKRYTPLTPSSIQKAIWVINQECAMLKLRWILGSLKMMNGDQGQCSGTKTVEWVQCAYPRIHVIYIVVRNAQIFVCSL